MALIVQKYGGSSVATLDRLRAVARHIVRTCQSGKRVVVVVSAMGETTDQLTRLAHAVSTNPLRRELDMLLTAGERQAMALLSLAVMNHGLEAVSFTGSQVGIITDRFHSDARIEQIKADRLRQALARGRVPIVAGFQGMSSDREITTLGRGGSDVTAVALAAVLRAERCELYKDVDGIHTENPAVFRAARRVPRIGFEELAELAGSGAQVIHPRACALAEKYRVPLVIRSSFSATKGGTTVTSTQRTGIEKALVRALTHTRQLVRLALTDVPAKKRCLHQVVTQLAAARVPVILFNHGVLHDGRFDLGFIVPGTSRAEAEAILARLVRKVQARGLDVNDGLCSVSAVGPGVGSDARILSAVFETLHRCGVHLDAFAASETRLTCFMDRKYLRIAAAALMARFRLNRD
ncbi:aspartate kinase [candidate division WOR-3 bacterium]|nr:aspartate kinase [candidate division WOR-3 bacterium]